jgi:hypothetical protein
MPRATPALSISAKVASIGWFVSDQAPGCQRRNESNIGSLIQSPFGCCIQASMIMVVVSVLVDYWSIMHPMK